ncbi:MAG: acyl-CoA thioesterase [Hyphomicrobiaceae bacterium]|nr:acyl-CoA thioesterase [Hyphomicrobiaceae bacterium]
MSDSQRKPPARRSAFRHFRVIPTRWMDNDLYGHVNNVVYYSYFDTIINRYLIEPGGIDIHEGTIIGIAVETGCRFHRSFAYPEDIEAGLRVGRLGTSSVRYELGLFGAGEDEARADGHFVHVFVDRQTMRPIPMPERLRAALARLAGETSE